MKVRISVAKSRAHAQSLKLELLSLETRQSPPPSEMASQDDVSHKMKRSELVKVRVRFLPDSEEQRILKTFRRRTRSIFKHCVNDSGFFCQEVKSSRVEEHKSVGTQGLDGDFAKLKSEFGQTHDSVSFYCLMEFFREMSLRDGDG